MSRRPMAARSAAWRRPVSPHAARSLSDFPPLSLFRSPSERRSSAPGVSDASFAALALLLALLGRFPVVGFNNARDKLMANDIGRGEADVADALDAVKKPHRVGEAGGLAGRQIDLARIAGHHHPAALAKPREQHFHLHRGGVLRLV